MHDYFEDLRHSLRRQEEVALSVVNTFVREKKCALQESIEALTMILSRVTSLEANLEKKSSLGDVDLIIRRYSSDIETSECFLYLFHLNFAGWMSIPPAGISFMRNWFFFWQSWVARWRFSILFMNKIENRQRATQLCQKKNQFRINEIHLRRSNRYGANEFRLCKIDSFFDFFFLVSKLNFTQKID